MQRGARNILGAILGAIDVGTNAVRLKLVEPIGGGHYEVLYQNREPVRPGEGVFATGVMRPEVLQRLVEVLSRYADLSRRYNAQVRAVATSALREAANQREVLATIRRETGIELEVISGKEEARLICLGVLQGCDEHTVSSVLDIGGGSTEVVLAQGTRPVSLWSVGLGCVQLTEMFNTSAAVKPSDLGLMRDYAAQTIQKALPGGLGLTPSQVLGSSGTVRAITAFATGDAERTYRAATLEQVSRTVDELAAMPFEQRAGKVETKRAEVIVAGAVVLEAVMRHLGFATMTPTPRGLRDGLIIDIDRKRTTHLTDGFLVETVLAVGRRFSFHEAHALQVARLALALFDTLSGPLKLPASARSLLEVAALLDDIGYVVNRQGHHAHSSYLIGNMDLPGISLRERDVVALMVRFDGKSLKKKENPDLGSFSKEEGQIIQRLGALLRLADSLDRSHRQLVRGLTATLRGGVLHVLLEAPEPLDLELWSARKLANHLTPILGASVEFQVALAAASPEGR